MGLIHKLDPFA